MVQNRKLHKKAIKQNDGLPENLVGRRKSWQQEHEYSVAGTGDFRKNNQVSTEETHALVSKDENLFPPCEAESFAYR